VGERDAVYGNNGPGFECEFRYQTEPVFRLGFSAAYFRNFPLRERPSWVCAAKPPPSACTCAHLDIHSGVPVFGDPLSVSL